MERSDSKRSCVRKLSEAAGMDGRGIKALMMAIFGKFRSFLEEQSPIADREMDYLQSVCTARRLKKRQSLHLEGEAFPYVIWVASGCLRLYFVDGKSNEHVVDLAIKGQFVADRIHLHTKKASMFNIDAILDSEMILLPADKLGEMVRAVPSLDTVLLHASLRSMANYQRRIAISLTLSVEERLRLAERDFGELVRLVPQNILAGFLGVNPATLSRVRAKQMGQQES